MKRSTEDLTAMAQAIQSNQVAAKLWLDEGFSPGDAKAYVEAGCFDVTRTVELRQVGITPLDVTRVGLAWDYCSGAISLNEVLRLIRPSKAERETELPWDESPAQNVGREPQSKCDQHHAGFNPQRQKKHFKTKQAEGGTEPH